MRWCGAAVTIARAVTTLGRTVDVGVPHPRLSALARPAARGTRGAPGQGGQRVSDTVSAQPHTGALFSAGRASGLSAQGRRSRSCQLRTREIRRARTRFYRNPRLLYVDPIFCGALGVWNRGLAGSLTFVYVLCAIVLRRASCARHSRVSSATRSPAPHVGWSSSCAPDPSPTDPLQ